MKIKSILFFLIWMFAAMFSIAQTGIGTTTPNPSAKLDVYATNKGFLPPRVTLTSITDVTTIASPAEGLLVYNLGSVGLQAGYYYWNGANWATIATATSAGNGVTSMDMVKLYSKSYSNAIADSTIANATGYKFTVPVSGRYLFDFSSTGFANATITYKVRQGTTDLGSDFQTSYNNSVHVEYNGKVEVNLQAGTTYNVYVTSSGSRDAGDYDRVYYKLVAGNLPVTGQTVDYVSVSNIYQTGIGVNRDLIFTSNNGGTIPYNTSTGVFTLSANKTYLFQAQIRSNTPSADANYIEYGFVDATTNTLLVDGTQTITTSTTSTAGYGSNPVINFIYTPITNQTVKIRTIGSTRGTQLVISGTANITQIGSSAIINPWVLSGSNVYNITGNVGIGTNAPTNKLHVYDNSNTGWSSPLALDGNVATNGTSFNIRNNNDIEWHIDNHGSASSTPNTLNLWNSAANASVFTLGTDGQLKLNTNSNTSLNITANTIDNNGMVILNANTGSNWANNWHEFVLFQKQGSVLGNIVAGNNGTTIAYNTTSDYRLKTDFKSFNGIDLVSKIKIYDYAWKVDNSRMYGVKAHELQTILPYLVFGEKDAVDKLGKIIPQTVDYSKLTPILVKAIQEQEIKMKDQDSRLLKMQKEKDSLEKRVSDLESLMKLVKKNK